MNLWSSIHSPSSLASDSVRPSHTRLCVGLLVALLAACGGGGGGGDSPGGGTPPSAGLAGAWYYDGAGTAVRFDLATAGETSVTLDTHSTQLIGYGGGQFTDVERDSSASPTLFTVNLRRSTAPYLEKTSALPVFSISGGYVSGRVQPSPSGALYAMHTLETADLADPYTDYVYLFDANLTAVLRLANVRDPTWLGNDRIVVVGDDGLFSAAATSSGTPTRIGAPGLGVLGALPERPAVSPDARSIVFVQGDAVWRIGVDGSALTQLTLAAAGQTWPTWSPDGLRLAVIRGACPPVGAGLPPPDVAVVSASTANQNIANAALVNRTVGAPVRTCGPITWLAQ